MRPAPVAGNTEGLFHRLHRLPRFRHPEDNFSFDFCLLVTGQLKLPRCWRLKPEYLFPGRDTLLDLGIELFWSSSAFSASSAVKRLLVVTNQQSPKVQKSKSP